MNNFDLKSYLSNNTLLKENTQLEKLFSEKNFRNERVQEFFLKQSEDFINDIISNTLNTSNSLESLTPPSGENENLLFRTTFTQGSNAGNMGEGELYAIIKLKGATAGTKGDMTYKGEEVEIKKSNQREFSGTYSMEGVLGRFSSLRILITLRELIMAELIVYGGAPRLMKKGSDEFRKFLKYLLKKIQIVKNTSQPNFLSEEEDDGFENFDLSKLTDETEIEIVKEIHKILGKWKDRISVEEFISDFEEYTKKYFDKADKLLLFAKASNPENAEIVVLDKEKLDGIIDKTGSEIRGGFTAYTKLGKDSAIKGKSKYSPYERMSRGYKIDIALIQFFKDFAENLYKKTDI